VVIGTSPEDSGASLRLSIAKVDLSAAKTISPLDTSSLQYMQ
jgi:hypothetical protein